MKRFDFKKILPYAGIILAFLCISYAYTPQVLKGKVVNQSDISSWQGMAHEILEHNGQNPDDKALWTNSMFGGMPATSISVIYDGDYTQPLYKTLFWGERPASYFFLCMVGGFLLMLSFGCNIWLAALGGIAMAFCSYNMQIMQVGHNSKMVAIAFMPWVLAAVVYAYRKCAFWGGVLFAFALSFEIKANHPQITYYLAIVIFGYAIWQLCAAIKEKMLPKFIRTSLVLLVTGLIGIATNINHLWPTYEYAQHTMRGGTELTAEGSSTQESQSGKKSRSGLDLEYATAWSYGIEETANLLIPNFNGGASAGELGRNSATYDALRKNGYNAEQIIKALPLYWGPQPFTAGPMYMGAISIFLCVLGFFVLKGGLKWWVGGVSLLALMLSWGYHFMPMSQLFFNFAPLYNKFRTVSMILVILQILIPLLGIVTANELLFKSENYNKNRVQKGFCWALVFTAGFSLLFMAIPSLAGSFSSASDVQLPEVLADSLEQDRVSLLRSDALRTIIYIVVAAGILWMGYMKKLKGVHVAALLIILVTIDLWSVGKRYLNDSHFVTKREFGNVFNKRPADEFILQDKSQDYRVLDLSVNTFNDAYVSYHHKTIGGYSPAKLQRYQDMIEHHISREIGAISKDMSGVRTIQDAQNALGNYPILNMLNTKYIVLDGNAPALVNYNTLGNAWFVTNISKAANANEEIAMLSYINPAQEAIIAQEFITPEYLGEFYNPIANSRGNTCYFPVDSAAAISLESYSPNRLVYRYSSATPAIAIFSEVFYKDGWKAVVKQAASENNPSENVLEPKIFRANYILRALALPAGSGEIEFTFEPESFTKGELYSRIASGLLIILLLGGIAFHFARRVKK
ncbi:MAG: hypothetical protein IKY70_02740 [Bacteroidales bacterium]|nr:hypothetical protein [Bacteroidales bacterium]